MMCSSTFTILSNLKTGRQNRQIPLKSTKSCQDHAILANVMQFMHDHAILAKVMQFLHDHAILAKNMPFLPRSCHSCQDHAIIVRQSNLGSFLHCSSQ